MREPMESHDASDRFPTFMSFDCATFVYTVNALMAASSVDEYLSIIDTVRYCGPRGTDTLIHYTLNSLRKFEALGVLREVTLVNKDLLKERTVMLDDRGGGNWFITRQKIGDLNRGTLVRYSFAPTSVWTDDMPGVSNGDTIVVVSNKLPDQYPGIVGHLGIALRTPCNTVTMYHCSKMPVGTKDGPSAGVSLLKYWDEVNEALRMDDKVRSVANYLRSNPELFCGASVFRPICP